MAIERIEIYDVDGNLVSYNEVTTNDLTNEELLLIQQQNEINNPLNVSMVEMFSLENNWIGRTVINSTLGLPCIWNGDNWVNTLGVIVYDILFHDNFESGNLNKWNVLNDECNGWYVGVGERLTGSYSVYISGDGGYTSNYTGTCSDVSHIYFDVNIPSDLKDIRLTYTWKCEGEISKDFMNVYNIPKNITPEIGVELDDIYEIGIGDHSDNHIWKEERVSLDNALIGDRRIVFSWLNDSSTSNMLAACIDNVYLEYIK